MSMNWQTIVNDIRARTGWTDTQLAEHAECSQSTIQRLRSGAIIDPRASLADRLRDIHKRYKRRKVAA